LGDPANLARLNTRLAALSLEGNSSWPSVPRGLHDLVGPVAQHPCAWSSRICPVCPALDDCACPRCVRGAVGPGSGFPTATGVEPPVGFGLSGLGQRSLRHPFLMGRSQRGRSRVSVPDLCAGRARAARINGFYVLGSCSNGTTEQTRSGQPRTRA
jgi:hypothetical protein